jgi:hypothetical protein
MLILCLSYFNTTIPDFHIPRTAKVELAIKNNYFLNFAGEQKLEIVDALQRRRRRGGRAGQGKTTTAAPPPPCILLNRGKTEVLPVLPPTAPLL